MDRNNGINDQESESSEAEFHKKESDNKTKSCDFLSKPILSNACSLPIDAIDLHHSFGYDCRMHFNLQAVDEETLLFISGNLIHVFNVHSKTLSFRRSAGGGGLGHILRNQNINYSDHIAVAEKGEDPLIIIYRWPKWEIVSILRNGSRKEYTHLDFSPDGKLLASQSGFPDHLLTIWDWRKSSIILSVKSHNTQVFNVKFSKYVPGELATCGVEHVKFWKILRTFTGLKIEGKLGRFGKTEVSDILGVFPMPNNCTLTGCNWGNMLVWEDDAIKVEVTRKGRKPCHSAAIVQFRYHHDSKELTSISIGDFIKVWNFSAVETFYPSEDERFIEMKPIYEIQVKDNSSVAHFYSMAKRDLGNERDKQDWFGQDLNGGIWDVDMAITRNVRESKKLYWCHAKSISDIAASPYGYYVASIGEDGRLHVYDIEIKKLIIIKQFSSPGCCLCWLPSHVAKSGSIIVAGFGDGTIKVIIVFIQKRIQSKEENNFDWTSVIQTSKPHTQDVTKISLNFSGSYLFTGSKDCTVFMYEIQKNKTVDVSLCPIGFVQVPSTVTCLNFNPKNDNAILVGCSNGQLLEVELSSKQSYDTKDTYKLECVCNIFSSCNDNSSEENQIGGSKCIESAPVLYAAYTKFGSVLLTHDSKNSPCIYEFKNGPSSNACCIKIPGAENSSLSYFLFTDTQKFLLFGFTNGKIRVTEMDCTISNDLSKYWELSMHDNFYGLIPKLCLTHDQRFLLSCGSDGNLFSYKFNFTDNIYLDYKPLPTTYVQPVFSAVDEFEDLIFSLEEKKQNAKHDQILKSNMDKKALVRSMLKELKSQFDEVLKMNSELPPSQILPHSTFELDFRISKYVQQKIQDELDHLNKKMAYDIEKSKLGLQKVSKHFTDPIQHYSLNVFAVRTFHKAKTFFLKKLGKDFEKDHEEVKQQRAEEIKTQIERNERFESMLMKEKESLKVEQIDIDTVPKLLPVESFLKDIEQFQFRLPLKTKRLLERYFLKRTRNKHRDKKWQELMKTQSQDTNTDSSNKLLLQKAYDSIGDYKLKSGEDFEVPPELHKTKLQQCSLLLETKLKIFNMKNEFNEKVLNLRKEKLDLIVKFRKLHHRLATLVQELPPELIREAPPIPELQLPLEYPEREYQVGNKDLINCPELEVSTYDEELEILSNKPTESYNALSSLTFDNKLPQLWQNEVTIESLLKHITDDEVDTEHELELKSLRLTRHLKEQLYIIREMEDSIKAFDAKVETLSEERVVIAVDIKFLETYSLTLHQELIVIQNFENRENQFLNEVMEKLTEKNSKQILMDETCLKIKDQCQELKELQEVEKNIIKSFTEATIDYTHAKYLQKIFKKKCSQRKFACEDGGTSESMSLTSSDSSSSEVENELHESVEFGAFNEKICPPNCDPHLYQLAFTSRTERHEVEQSILKKKEEIDSLKKKLENFEKQMKMVENSLQSSKSNLNSLRKEKQKALNEVETVVVLNLNQIHYFPDHSELEKFDNTIVFSNLGLQKLHLRLSELKEETDKIKIEGRKKQTHLHRLKLDCKKMIDEISELEKRIAQTIFIKFGQPLDVDTLEEMVLRELLNDVRSSLPEVKKELDNEILKQREIIKEKEKKIVSLLQENTEKTEILTTLEEELEKLKAIIKRQDNLKNSKSIDHGQEWREDIEKLLKIKTRLKLKQEVLRSEIRDLSFKGRPLPPISSPPPPKIEDSEDYLFRNMTANSLYFSENLESKLDSREKSKPNRIELLDNTREYLLEKIEAILTLLDIPSSFKELVMKQLLDDLISAIEGSNENAEFILLAKETFETILDMLQVDVASTVPSKVSIKNILHETLQSLYGKCTKTSGRSKKVSVEQMQQNFNNELEKISKTLVEDVLKRKLEEMNVNEDVT